MCSSWSSATSSTRPLLLVTEACIYVQLQRDAKIDKLPQDAFVEQTLEILMALRKLGDTLKPDEEAFLASHSTDNLRLFEKVDQQQLGEFTALLSNILLSRYRVGWRNWATLHQCYH